MKPAAARHKQSALRAAKRVGPIAIASKPASHVRMRRRRKTPLPVVPFMQKAQQQLQSTGAAAPKGSLTKVREENKTTLNKRVTGDEPLTMEVCDDVADPSPVHST